MTTSLTIRSVVARAVLAPLKRPVRTAVGTIPSAPLVLIDLQTDQGPVGRAYLFGYTPTALMPLVRLIGEIAPALAGQAVAPVERMCDFDRRFRLIGWQGLIGMAVGGIDMACWDALGRALDQPVVRLLGGVPKELPAYDSYGIVDPKADEAVIHGSVEAGFRAIKIKLGGGELAADVAAVRAVRGWIGPEVALMVDYNQSLDPVEALRRIERLAEYDLHWVEEPVRADDIHGHATVRAGSPVRIQTGENWWFPRDMANAIAAGASDLAMLDVMKIGGITGWLRAMGQAEAASLPVSSHIFVEASAHLLPVTPTAHWLEWLDLAGAVMAAPLRPVGGTVTATGPGLGIDWDEAAVTRYSVGG
jgi:mandelate racemase